MIEAVRAQTGETSHLQVREGTSIRPWLLLWSGIFTIGAVLTWLSMAQYSSYTSGMFDLGNMAQAIASVMRGEPLVVTSYAGQTSRLAGHVELVYFLLALPYAVWPDPRLLLIIQAALFAVSAFSVFRLALRTTANASIACALAFIYLLYPVAQTAVLFDVHGDTLAMPLLVFALDALDRRAWRPYALFIALALSCKVYVAVPVLVLGCLIWWQRRERTVALATIAAAVGYGTVAFFVIRPWFTTAHTAEGHRHLNYLAFYFGDIQQVVASLEWRALNAVIVFGPALLLCVRGWPWLLPGLPVAAATLLTTVPGAAHYNFHHYALVVPFIIMAAIKGTAAWQQTNVVRQSQVIAKHVRRRTPLVLVVVTLEITLLANSLLVNTPINIRFWQEGARGGLTEGVYQVTVRDRLKDRFLAQYVPSNAALAVTTFLAPHLVNRDTLYLVRYLSNHNQKQSHFPAIMEQVEYVLVDMLVGPKINIVATERDEIGQVLRNPAFGVVAARDGLVLFQRQPAKAAVLGQQISVEPATSALTAAADGHNIDRVATTITPLGERRFRATFAWRAAAPVGPMLAISSLDGVPNARFVHLPSYALAPTENWHPDQVVRETFELEIPRDVPAGAYMWRVSWYDLTDPDVYATDERSQVGISESVAQIVVP